MRPTVGVQSSGALKRTATGLGEALCENDRVVELETVANVDERVDQTCRERNNHARPLGTASRVGLMRENVLLKNFLRAQASNFVVEEC